MNKTANSNGSLECRVADLERQVAALENYPEHAPKLPATTKPATTKLETDYYNHTVEEDRKLANLVRNLPEGCKIGRTMQPSGSDYQFRFERHGEASEDVFAATPDEAITGGLKTTDKAYQAIYHHR